jgi:hypothetical protein
MRSISFRKENFRKYDNGTPNVQLTCIQDVGRVWVMGGQTATDWHLPLKVQILTLHL